MFVDSDMSDGMSAAAVHLSVSVVLAELGDVVSGVVEKNVVGVMHGGRGPCNW